MGIKSCKTVLLVLALSVLALAVLSIGGQASRAGWDALSDDELTTIAAMGSQGLHIGPDCFGGLRFIYCGITERSFANAKGIVTVVQVPGDFNDVYVPVFVNIFVYMVQVQSGASINFNISLPPCNTVAQ